MHNVLIVDQTITAGMEFLDFLALPDVRVVFTDRVPQAIKNVKKTSYDFIILGDRAEDGKVYDVGLAVKDSRRNKHTAIVCVGSNRGKVATVMKLLSPYALSAETSQLTTTVDRIKSHLNIKKEQSSL
jgi:DNA-binding NtrC family response regulator